MMKFLKSFFLTLRERFSNRKRTSPVDVVDANEVLSRYIFSTRYFSRNPPRIKAEAYMPNLGEVSVFRVSGLTESAIWEIGSDVGRKSRRTLYGRGDTKAAVIRKLGLEILPREPPPRHANLVGWTENDKPRQKLIALEVAAAAEFVMKPNNPLSVETFAPD